MPSEPVRCRRIPAVHPALAQHPGREAAVEKQHQEKDHARRKSNSPGSRCFHGGSGSPAASAGGPAMAPRAARPATESNSPADPALSMPPAAPRPIGNSRGTSGFRLKSTTATHTTSSTPNIAVAELDPLDAELLAKQTARRQHHEHHHAQIKPVQRNRHQFQRAEQILAQREHRQRQRHHLIEIENQPERLGELVEKQRQRFLPARMPFRHDLRQETRTASARTHWESQTAAGPAART